MVKFGWNHFWKWADTWCDHFCLVSYEKDKKFQVISGFLLHAIFTLETKMSQTSFFSFLFCNLHGLFPSLLVTGKLLENTKVKRSCVVSNAANFGFATTGQSKAKNVKLLQSQKKKKKAICLQKGICTLPGRVLPLRIVNVAISPQMLVCFQ